MFLKTDKDHEKLTNKKVYDKNWELLKVYDDLLSESFKVHTHF